MQSFPSSPPFISPKELRPGRYWYVVAAAVAVVMCLLGLVIGVLRFKSVLDSVDTGHRFVNGDTITLQLEPDGDRGIWATYPGPSPGPKCGISGPGDPRLTDPGTDVSLTRDETWNLIYTFDVQRSGYYKITCSSQAETRYALGNDGGVLAFVGGLVLAVVLPTAGVGICAVIVVITALRRNSHHKRLLAERAGCGGHPGYTRYPGPGR
ncbi:hypothetical protein [Streptomyces sp. VRA16 Mangrove soil]|uniref:hypothetical protein n=1 Tax=Streptomyces sp. VRA16 Mangrove soil TaxID=2817434 RepID=UPI001A9FECE5|nr:hypothetical protein [Streptomyces sp. VRA16 Mangrove soil]MBO1337675.1 hypothetical protein [Streptomyces sp. VRA16 Mangrove soil]